jgi:hypothetical protein
VGVGEGLARADDGGQIALHELWGMLALFVGWARGVVGGESRGGEGRRGQERGASVPS